MRCPICLGHFVDAVHTPCGHVFCYTCTFAWFQTSFTCPICCRSLYNTRSVPLRWPEKVEAYTHEEHFDFRLNSEVVGLRVWEFDMFMATEHEHEVGDDDPVVVSYYDLLSTAVGGLVWLRSQAGKNAALSEEMREKVRQDWIQVGVAFESVLRTVRGRKMEAARLEGLLERKLWPTPRVYQRKPPVDKPAKAPLGSDEASRMESVDDGWAKHTTEKRMLIHWILYQGARRYQSLEMVA